MDRIIHAMVRTRFGAILGIGTLVATLLVRPATAIAPAFERNRHVLRLAKAQMCTRSSVECASWLHAVERSLDQRDETDVDVSLHLSLARAYAMHGYYDEAVLALENVGEDSLSCDRMLVEADIRWLVGQRDAALAILRNDPNLVRSLLEQCYAYRQIDPPRAERACLLAVHAAPKNDWARYFLSLVYYQNGDSVAAEEQLRVALSLKPGDTRYESLLADILSPEHHTADGMTPSYTSDTTKPRLLK